MSMTRNNEKDGAMLWKDENFITREAQDDGEAGVSRDDFRYALQIWICMAGRPSVAAAAATFNTTPQIVIEEVRTAHWMFLETEGGLLIADGASIDDPARAMIALEGE